MFLISLVIFLSVYNTHYWTPFIYDQDLEFFTQLDGSDCINFKDNSINVDETFGIYIESVKYLRYQSIPNMLIRLATFSGLSKGSTLSLKAYLHLELPKTVVDSCGFNLYTTPFQSTIYITSYGTVGHFSSLKNLFQKVVNSSLWEYGMSVTIILKHEGTSGTTITAKKAQLYLYHNYEGKQVDFVLYIYI